VVAIPDPRKGEQLVLVTEKPDAERDELARAARAAGYPELWVPRAILVTEAVPVLGSGKIDYPAAQKLAASNRPLL
jgi:acyl-[acyl-carrier-protein]-phospholipid O-acyltransferase/long-chain-fatty-acid--[acyl-carrier-protein] ligase